MSKDERPPGARLAANLERAYAGALAALGWAVQPLAWLADVASIDPQRRAKAARWMRRNYHWVFISVGGALFVLFALSAFWQIRGAIYEVLALLHTAIDGDAEDKADAIRNYAYTIGALLAGIALLAAIPFQLIKTWVNERQTDATEQGLITDRFTKAVGQLGEEKTQKRRVRSVRYALGDETREVTETADQPLVLPSGTSDRENGPWETYEARVPNIEVRLGAIYALERIAEDSERDHIPVMETLCAYVRENAPASGARDLNLAEWEPRPDAMTEAEAALREKELEARFDMDTGNIGEWAHALPDPRADVQAALTVIGRRPAARIAHERDPRRARPFALDLRGTNLQRADLSRAALAHARLDGARLEGAALREAQLEGAYIVEARLEGAALDRARLDRANLCGARLEGADLVWAGLEGADLVWAGLEGADLVWAGLEGADLVEARLEGADLGGARLEGADLFGARLEGAALDGARLQSADLRGWTCARSRLRSTDFTDVTTLDPESLESAFGVRAGIGLTVLPEGVPYPAHWHGAAEAEEDGLKHMQAFEADYRAWLAAGCPTGADWRDLS